MEKTLPAPVKIPAELLSDEALLGVYESFVLREGTDYGLNELSLETKIANLRKRVVSGKAHLIFDPETESVTFLTDTEWKKLSRASDGVASV